MRKIVDWNGTNTAPSTFSSGDIVGSQQVMGPGTSGKFVARHLRERERERLDLVASGKHLALAYGVRERERKSLCAEYMSEERD